MKTLRSALVTIVLSMAPVLAWAAPGGGIAGTKHDFSVKGGGVGVCTFCHTPHRALSTPLLWNHKLSVNTFSWDVPATTAGTTFPTFKGDTYKGPTAKCLSCHDGSVAVGDIAWWNGGVPGAPLDMTKHDTDVYNVGLNGNLAGNHPVAMPFPYNNTGSTYNGVTTGRGAVLTEWQSDPTTLNIRLFHDDGTGNITAGPVLARTGIECSSCHDPHNKASVDTFFLRGRLSGSDTTYLCQKCHIK